MRFITLLCVLGLLASVHAQYDQTPPAQDTSTSSSVASDLPASSSTGAGAQSGSAQGSSQQDGSDSRPELVSDEDNPVSVVSRTFIISQTTNPDGSTSQELVEADEARPGQTIEYQLTITNNGDTALPDSAVSVYGPVPEGTYAVENSGTPNSGDVQQEFLETPDYTGWRWTIIRNFAPQEVISLSYRVVIE